MEKSYYIYRFIDIDNKIIYIGRTNSIERRIFKEHFTELGHLSDECYKAIERIEYIQLKYESEMVAYEAILINKEKPKYNIQFKDNADFEIKLIEFNWSVLDVDDSYLDYLKTRKDKLVKISDYLCNAELFNENKTYVKTGLDSIDEKLITRKNSLILLSSVDRKASVAYAISQCVNLARENNKILYISLFDTSNTISENIVSHLSLVPLENILRGKLTEKNWMNISTASKEMSEMDITISNLNYQEKSINSVINIINEDSYDFIVIDNLDCLQSDIPIYNKDKTKDLLERLKGVCNDIDTPILLIDSLSSNIINSRVDKRPIITDLLYDSMEQFTDIIIFLYHDKRYNMLCEKPDNLEVIISKNCCDEISIVEVLYLDKFSILLTLDGDI